MSKQLMYICSPYRGNVKRNKEYARELTMKAIENGYLPVTVHLYITEVVHDEVPEEREFGMKVGTEILEKCQCILIGGRYGISEGMAGEIAKALDTGKMILTETVDGITESIDRAVLKRYADRFKHGWDTSEEGQ